MKQPKYPITVSAHGGAFTTIGRVRLALREHGVSVAECDRYVERATAAANYRTETERWVTLSD